MKVLRRGGRRLLPAYLLLLVASHAVRWLGPPEAPPLAGRQVVEVPAVAGTGEAPGRVRLAYRTWAPAGAEESPPVLLLLHGSPGSSRDFERLGPELARRFRVVAPDLPGFGASTRRVPEYSIRAHAAYARRLLDHLRVPKAHVLGFSMGGGVALELAAQEPDRVASLTLLSSIGVQEMELLGSHGLNHALHGLQLGLLWTVLEGVPHFGAFDGGLLGIPYARNFFDSDQRPLRGVLERFEGPLLLLHGERDPLVAVAAAREHHRIVPQSELVLLDGGHLMVFAGGERLSAPIRDFVARAEAGRAPTRATAAAERREAASEPFDPARIPPISGLALVVLLVLIAASTLVSEDLTCIAAGVLVAQGRLGFAAAATASLVGIFVGDLLLYAAGRFLGRPWLTRAPLKWVVRPEAVETSSRWFSRRGPAVILLSRFTPGTRLATYVVAGLLRTSFWRFSLWFLLAAALWTPALVGAAALVGSRATALFAAASRHAAWAVPALILALFLLLKTGVLLLTWKGRRRLLGFFRRKVRWEFWPPWVLYPPILAHVGWLAVRHRSLTVFTAANPGIPAGGFIGESKAAILEGLDPAWVARFRRLPAACSAEEKLALARAFAAEEGLEPPLVVKPDAGQRGSGVVVARSWERIAGALLRTPGEALVQEYVAGPEFGVFYARRPGDERGRIFSITEKRLPTVVGDGRRTVEELVLADERAVCTARAYFERLADRLEEVPAPGEVVRLTDLGTHCRGAVFLDGAGHWSAELEAAVDSIARSFAGFFFGRFDLKAPSGEDFRAGRGLKVLELNGVTSEATHIYDPRHGFAYALGVLARQWSLAFEIGRENRSRGVPVEGAGRLVRRLIEFRSGALREESPAPPGRRERPPRRRRPSAAGRRAARR